MKDYLQRIEKPVFRVLLMIPLFTWLIVYFMAPKINPDIRPTIDVTTLYYFDVWLLHYLPSTYLAALHCTFLDVLGAIAYTLHTGWPAVFLVYMVIFRRRDLILPYVNCFGSVCLLALITQLCLPTAPPWYYYNYNFTAANYSMIGDPAGLIRVDQKFGINFYRNMFDASPVVFGSFPSLHVAWPTLLALFVWFDTTLHKAFKWAAVGYVVFVSLAVMYLQHHYFVDVFGGIFYSVCVYKLLGLKNPIPPPRPPLIPIPCCKV